MIETGEILQTMRMIQEENFDIRTITLGINLLDCSDPDPDRCAQRVGPFFTASLFIFFLSLKLMFYILISLYTTIHRSYDPCCRCYS